MSIERLCNDCHRVVKPDATTWSKNHCTCEKTDSLIMLLTLCLLYDVNQNILQADTKPDEKPGTPGRAAQLVQVALL